MCIRNNIRKNINSYISRNYYKTKKKANENIQVMHLWTIFCTYLFSFSSSFFFFLAFFPSYIRHYIFWLLSGFDVRGSIVHFTIQHIKQSFSIFLVVFNLYQQICNKQMLCRMFIFHYVFPVSLPLVCFKENEEDKLLQRRKRLQRLRLIIFLFSFSIYIRKFLVHYVACIQYIKQTNKNKIICKHIKRIIELRTCFKFN